MSNGSQCCALEICCNFAEMLEKLPAAIALHTGMEEGDCLAFLHRMDAAGLTFAPKAFDFVARDMHVGPFPTTSPVGEYADLHKWMEHEELTFAPKSFRHVVDLVSKVARKHV